MSEQIDWSKAPEGYPLWITDPDGIIMHGWHKEIEGKYVDMRGCFWNKSGGGFTVHERPATPSWSGEGLPPVGVKVLIMNPEQFAITDYGQEFVGEECTVRAAFVNDLGYSMVAVEKVGGACYCLISEMCFPICTHEQIAADEREAAIERACADIEKRIEGFNVQLSYSLAIRATIEAMIDAGYRKQSTCDPTGYDD